MSQRIQLRRGTATAWATANPVLASGEPGWDTTNLLLKIGDGATAWDDLDSYGGAEGVDVPAVLLADQAVRATEVLHQHRRSVHGVDLSEAVGHSGSVRARIGLSTRFCGGKLGVTPSETTSHSPRASPVIGTNRTGKSSISFISWPVF